MGVTAGQCSHPNTAEPLQRPGLNRTKEDIPISLIKEVLNQLPSRLTSFTLGLEVRIINHHIQTHPSRGQTTAIYTQLGDFNQGTLGSCYSEGISPTPVPVAHSGSSPGKLHAGLNKRGSTRRGDFQLGGKRSSDSCQEASSTLNQSSVCGSQKRKRVATNYIPTAAKPVYRSPTLQDGGTAHATILTPAGSSPGQRQLAVPLNYNFTFTCVDTRGAMTKVGMDHIFP